MENFQNLWIIWKKKRNLKKIIVVEKKNEKILIIFNL